MPEDAKRRNSRKKKKRKAAKKRSFFQSIFSAVKYVVLSINRYTTRTDDRGPDREFHLGRHKLTFVGFMALVMAASWFMGSADRRLPPRDWLPPLASFIAMLALRFASRPAAGDRA